MAPKTALSVRGKLLFSFVLCLIGFILFSTTHFRFPLLFFTPFFVECLLFTSLTYCLWFTALTGLFVDLFSSTPFGLFTLNFSLSMAVFFRFRQLFNDKILSKTLFSFLLSAIISLFFPILLYLLGKKIPLHFVWFITDAFFMPILDALYALIFVFLPQKGIQILYKKIWLFLVTKRWISPRRT